MGNRAGKIQKKAWRQVNGICQEPDCGEKVYTVKGEELTRCATHAGKHADREAERRADFRKRGLCAECKEHRPLQPGLATCRTCAGLTEDMVGDWCGGKSRTIMKMSRAGKKGLLP